MPGDEGRETPPQSAPQLYLMVFSAYLAYLAVEDQAETIVPILCSVNTVSHAAMAAGLLAEYKTFLLPLQTILYAAVIYAKDDMASPSLQTYGAVALAMLHAVVYPLIVEYNKFLARLPQATSRHTQATSRLPQATSRHTQATARLSEATARLAQASREVEHHED